MKVLVLARLCGVVLAAACFVPGCSESPTAPGATVTIAQVQPAGVAIGATVTVLGSGFSTTGNTVRLGPGYLRSVAASTPSTLQFTLRSYLHPCPPTVDICVQTIIVVQPGAYQLAVANEKGTSNAVTVQVLPQ